MCCPPCRWTQISTAAPSIRHLSQEPPYDVCRMLVVHAWWFLVDAAASVRQTVGALRKARHGEGPVLLAAGVAKGLRQALPAEVVSLNDLDVRAQRCATVQLFDHDVPEEPFAQFWSHFWDSLACSYTERVGRLRTDVMSTGDFYSDRQWHSTGMYTECIGPAGLDKELIIPLPAPLGISRRLVFFRPPGTPFTDGECAAAMLLQPHISEALRVHARLTADRLLTARQVELLQLVAAGHDNNAIARQLNLSRGTVRKHLENAFTRLRVSSRTAAVARAFPDTTWI
jgi:DNA-binding CsgD family transcriptional regulator